MIPRALIVPCTVAVLLAGCGSPSLDRSVYTVNVCRGTQWSPLAGVSVSAAGTYVGLVVTTSGMPTTTSRQVVSALGTPCTAAPDPVACRTAVASAATTRGWETHTCGGAGCTTTTRFLVTERAGVVTVVADNTDLAALLAPVTTPAAAALLASYRVDPNGIDCTAPQVRLDSDGAFEVFLTHGDADCTDRVESNVRVAPDGTVVVLQQVTAPASRTCVSP